MDSMTDALTMSIKRVSMLANLYAIPAVYYIAVSQWHGFVVTVISVYCLTVHCFVSATVSAFDNRHVATRESGPAAPKFKFCPQACAIHLHQQVSSARIM